MGTIRVVTPSGHPTSPLHMADKNADLTAGGLFGLDGKIALVTGGGTGMSVVERAPFCLRTLEISTLNLILMFTFWGLSFS